jgi:hypothetical protein
MEFRLPTFEQRLGFSFATSAASVAAGVTLAAAGPAWADAGAFSDKGLSVVGSADADVSVSSSSTSSAAATGGIDATDNTRNTRDIRCMAVLSSVATNSAAELIVKRALFGKILWKITPPLWRQSGLAADRASPSCDGPQRSQNRRASYFPYLAATMAACRASQVACDATGPVVTAPS